MKKLLYLFALVFSMSASGQDMESLKPGVDQMIVATIGRDYETLMDLTYPKIFEFASREEYIETIKSAFDNDMMTVRLDLSQPNYRFSDVKNVGVRKFCVVRYDSRMDMHLKNPDKEMSAMIVDGLSRSGQYKSVSYDEKKKIISVAGDAILVGVADESTQHKWKFVNYAEENFTTLFDDQTKKALGL